MVTWLLFPGESPPERFVEVGHYVAIVAVTPGGDGLQASAGHSLVVVPQPTSQVVPEDVSHVVSGGGIFAVMTDHALKLVAVVLQPNISSSWQVLDGDGEIFIVVIVVVLVAASWLT